MKRLAALWAILLFLSSWAFAGIAVRMDSSPSSTGSPDGTAAFPLQTTTTLGATAGTFTDRSGSMTLGGTSQTLAAANAARKGMIIENPCTAASQGIGATESLFINFTSAAAINSTSIELAACGFLILNPGAVISTEAINVNATTTAHKWIAKEM